MAREREKEKNGWAEYQKLVIRDLERHDAKLDRIEKRLGTISKEISALKARSTLWGTIAGALAAVGIWFADKFTRH